MLWVYGRYTFSIISVRGSSLWRQILTSKDDLRTEGVNISCWLDRGWCWGGGGVDSGRRGWIPDGRWGVSIPGIRTSPRGHLPLSEGLVPPALSSSPPEWALRDWESEPCGRAAITAKNKHQLQGRWTNTLLTDRYWYHRQHKHG